MRWYLTGTDRRMRHLCCIMELSTGNVVNTLLFDEVAVFDFSKHSRAEHQLQAAEDLPQVSKYRSTTPSWKDPRRIHTPTGFIYWQYNRSWCVHTVQINSGQSCCVKRIIIGCSTAFYATNYACLNETSGGVISDSTVSVYLIISLLYLLV